MNAQRKAIPKHGSKKLKTQLTSQTIDENCKTEAESEAGNKWSKKLFKGKLLGLCICITQNSFTQTKTHLVLWATLHRTTCSYRMSKGRGRWGWRRRRSLRRDQWFRRRFLWEPRWSGSGRRSTIILNGEHTSKAPHRYPCTTAWTKTARGRFYPNACYHSHHGLQKAGRGLKFLYQMSKCGGHRDLTSIDVASRSNCGSAILAGKFLQVEHDLPQMEHYEVESRSPRFFLNHIHLKPS